MEQNNTQLPAEVVIEIKGRAKAKFPIPDVFADQPSCMDKREGYEAGATEYATTLFEFQKATIESDKQRKEANDELREAKKLLSEVFQKHESGLLPDRFVYEKIKLFLYGE